MNNQLPQNTIDDAIISHMDDAIALGERARRLRDIITAKLKEERNGANHGT